MSYTDPMGDQVPNPLRNGKIIGSQISYADYHRQEPGIGRGNPAYVMSRGELFEFSHNPRTWIDGGKPEKETDATAWGSLMDARVCPSKGAMDAFAIAPETCTATKTMGIVKSGKASAGDAVPWNPQCKEAKDWKEAVEEEGRVPLSREDLAECEAGYKRLLADERVKSLLAVSEFQVMVVWEYADKDTGLVIPGRSLIDILPLATGGDGPDSEWAQYVADYKTARNAGLRFWDAEVHKRGYDWQAAMEVDALERTSLGAGNTPRTFLHVIQESDPPHTVARRFLSQGYMSKGRLAYTLALRRYCRCLADKHWPSWDDEAHSGRMSLNGWTEVCLEPWMLNEA